MIDQQQFRHLIAARLRVSPDEVTDDADLVIDLGGDSLALAELTAELEQRHGVSLSADKLHHLETVGDLWSALQQSRRHSSQR